MKKSDEILRVIDANINRYREGIRVVEDIYRYVYNDKNISSSLKNLRHIKLPITQKELIDKRDSINDVLKTSTKSEQKRENLESIIIANLKRAQESARVLEEIFKLIDIKTSENFKENRYQLYNLEKKILM
ncbi:MAG: thiamine-phosphate pyrophosphorylase [Nautilia sp.]|nr:MAG: thiamine-phosphate pyrophosphorylase [Nautilia sp.]